MPSQMMGFSRFGAKQPEQFNPSAEQMLTLQYMLQLQKQQILRNQAAEMRKHDSGCPSSKSLSSHSCQCTLH